MTKEAIKVDNKVELFSNVRYLCRSSTLLTESLKEGKDVVQLPNGDIIVTEVKTVHTLYSWNIEKDKMVRSSSLIDPLERDSQ